MTGWFMCDCTAAMVGHVASSSGQSCRLRVKNRRWNDGFSCCRAEKVFGSLVASVSGGRVGFDGGYY